MRARAVIFDFNGTLSHDEPILLAIFQELFAEYGRPLSAEEYFDELAGLSDPEIVRTFQTVISDEARVQSLETFGRLPDRVVACVGGGSNAIGSFAAFIDDTGVALIGIEAGGRGPGLGDNAATLETGRPGILHGAHSYVLQDEHGQIARRPS